MPSWCWEKIAVQVSEAGWHTQNNRQEGGLGQEEHGKDMEERDSQKPKNFTLPDIWQG